MSLGFVYFTYCLWILYVLTFTSMRNETIFYLLLSRTWYLELLFSFSWRKLVTVSFFIFFLGSLMTLGHTYCCVSFYEFLRWVQVIMHELEATNDRFDVCQQRTNRAPIYEHRATIWRWFWDNLLRKKSCSDLLASG